MRIAVSLLLLLTTVATVSHAQYRDPLNPRDRREAQRDREDRDGDRREREEREERRRRHEEFERDFGRGGGRGDHWRRPDGRMDYGRRRHDRWADMEYRRRTRRFIEDRALIGERDPSAVLVGYTLLSDVRLDDDSFEVINRRVGARLGYDDIKVKVLGDDARIDEIEVRFCDSLPWEATRQIIPINQRLDEGASTEWVNLKGKNRCISGFSVVGVGNRRDEDETIVVVLGRNRRGN